MGAELWTIASLLVASAILAWIGVFMLAGLAWSLIAASAVLAIFAVVIARGVFRLG